MSGNLSYLFAAYSVLWLIIFFYVFILGKKQTDLKKEIEDLKRIAGDK